MVRHNSDSIYSAQHALLVSIFLKILRRFSMLANKCSVKWNEQRTKFIQNKSSSTVSQHWDQKQGNAKIAFHSLAQHSILSSELSLWFCFCAFASVVNTTYTKHWQRCRDRWWSSSAEAVFTRVHHTIEHSNSCRFVRLHSIKAFFRLTRKIQVLKLTGRFYKNLSKDQKNLDFSVHDPFNLSQNYEIKLLYLLFYIIFV